MAILRSLPGPVFFPVRTLAVVYVDFFRGVPTILVILMLGQGIPALQLSWLPTDQIFWASVALVLVYTAYVSEVYRAGIESVHPSQEAAARSLGLTHVQALRFVVVPQAVRRVIPPLLNDFIGLQKDTALVSVLGIVEVLRQTQIDQAATFNGTLLPRRRDALRRDHDPARALHRLARRARPPSTAGREARMTTSELGGTPALELEGVHKSFGKLEVLRGIDLTLAEHEVVCLIGASGSGKSTLLRCVNLLEPIDAGRIVVAGEELTARRRRRQPRPARDRDRLPVVQPLPAHGRARERHARAAEGARSLEGGRDRRGRRAARALRSRGQARRVPGQALGRPAAARRDRPRARRCSRRLLLLDEVTSALDPELVAEVLDVIRELAAGGMTMLIATHEMSFARDVANRVCFLHDGRILEQGPPEQVFGAPREDRTRQFLQRIVAAGRL